MNSRETQILDAAEKMVRAGGYDAFSFRDIAQNIGIKSASVHYHFPTKPNLGAAVARYYTERFLDMLGSPEDLISQDIDPIGFYAKTFTDAYVSDRQMCLCSLLGAQIKGLPAPVAQETKAFFEKNLAWLNKAIRLKNISDQPAQKAIEIFALLEGAMIVSNSLGDPKPLRTIAKTLGAH